MLSEGLSVGPGNQTIGQRRRFEDWVSSLKYLEYSSFLLYLLIWTGHFIMAYEVKYNRDLRS